MLHFPAIRFLLNVFHQALSVHFFLGGKISRVFILDKALVLFRQLPFQEVPELLSSSEYQFLRVLVAAQRCETVVIVALMLCVHLVVLRARVHEQE